tara:strand:+ start:702 stop:1730 length:1029 start_codon:yes stop_codon:yes gene_type:complete
MPFEKVEFEFPEEEKDEGVMIEIAPSSAQPMKVEGKDNGLNVSEDDDSDEVDFDDVEPKIEVVDDTPKKDRNRKASEAPAEVTDEELEAYSDKVKNRIKHFSKGYHDERRAKETAQREAEEAGTFAQNLVEENKKLKNDVNRNQSVLLDQAKKSVVIEVDAAKKAYKEAHENGDSDKLLEAQENLTAAKIKSDKLDNFKIPTLQEDQNPARVETESAPARVQIDEKADSWQQENPWFNRDVEMTGAALGLHNKLVNDGVKANSDAYYERINTRMREMFPDNFDGEPEVKSKRKASKNVVAPNTRSTMPKKIRLTRTQVTLAKRLGLKPEEYAKQVAIDMRKE